MGIQLTKKVSIFFFNFRFIELVLPPLENSEEDDIEVVHESIRLSFRELPCNGERASQASP